jgi:hypothetical protein
VFLMSDAAAEDEPAVLELGELALGPPLSREL